MERPLQDSNLHYATFVVWCHIQLGEGDTSAAIEVFLLTRTRSYRKRLADRKPRPAPAWQELS